MRRRTFRRRFLKRIGRPYRLKRMALSRQGKVYSFKRNVAVAPWAIVDGNPVVQPNGTYISNASVAGNYGFGHFRFRLSDLPSATDFTNLYERYKITGVKLRFVPVASTESSIGSASTFMSPLAIAINRGAITTTADDRTFDQLMENQDVRIFTTLKPFNVYIPYPKFYAPADGITTAQEKGGWLNSKTATVHHFGLNYAWQQTVATTANQCAFRVIATYYMKCANPQ